MAHEGLECVEEAVPGKKLEECCGLAARDNEAVDVGEFCWLADEDRICANVA